MTQPHTEAINSGRTSKLPNIGDWQFRSYLTMRLLPVFYILLLVGTFLVLAAIVVVCFYLYLPAGIGALVLAPVIFIATALFIRGALEYLVMAFRIMVSVESLTGRLEGVIDKVDDMHGAIMEVEPILHLAGRTTKLLEDIANIRNPGSSG